MPMKKSPRPRMRPEDLADRMEEQRMRDIIEMGNRQDPGMTREEMERGSSAPRRSPRPMRRPTQEFAEGGKVDSFPDLNKDGKVTKADVLKGRGVEGFAMGGEVRGCKGIQMGGKKFSGTF